MRLNHIDHVALTCASPEASKAWYVSVLGFEHVFPGKWDGIPIFLRLGPTFIALFPARSSAGESSPAAARIDHLAFRTSAYEEFEIAQKELTARGIGFVFQDHEIAHSIYFSDPDGHRLEITTYDIEKSYQ